MKDVVAPVFSTVIPLNIRVFSTAMELTIGSHAAVPSGAIFISMDGNFVYSHYELIFFTATNKDYLRVVVI